MRQRDVLAGVTASLIAAPSLVCAQAATCAWIGASEGSNEPFSQGLQPLDTSGAPGSLAEHFAAVDLPA